MSSPFQVYYPCNIKFTYIEDISRIIKMFIYLVNIFEFPVRRRSWAKELGQRGKRDSHKPCPHGIYSMVPNSAFKWRPILSAEGENCFQV